MVNPFNLSETQAAYYTKLKLSKLRGLSIPFLQYSETEPRYYRKQDLDKVINANVRNGGIHEIAT